MMKKQNNMIEQAIGRRGAAKPQAPAAGMPQMPAMGNDPQADDALLPLVNELYAMMQSGEAPEGFDLEAACQDEAFAMLCDEFGVKAAARIWAAEKRAEEAENAAMANVNQKMQSRKALPRSVNGGGFATPKPDYANMDAATFRKLSAQLKSAARDGKRVSL